MAKRPFAYGKGTLRCDGVALSEIADRFGTPTYVYSADAIRGAYHEMDRAFDRLPHRICYSVKANPNLSVCSLLAGLRAGADVTSGGELARALQAGFQPEQIVFAGAGKSRSEMEDALTAGIGCFSVESEGELRLLSAVAAERGAVARFALRVNPDVNAHTHPFITTGLASTKFGVPIADASDHYALAATLPGLRAEGVGMHIGSQMTDLSPVVEATQGLAALASKLLERGHTLRHIDIGGGYPIPYGDEQPDTPGQLATEIEPMLRPLGLVVLTEPGRWLVGTAGVLIVRVLYRKRNGAHAFIIVDGGMNALLRPALYRAQHKVVAVRENSRNTRAEVVGPVCESTDVLSFEAMAPDVQPGELLAILDAGAYGFSMASEYNGRPRPAEVLVDGAEARLVRRRQSHEEIMAPEMGL
ncbi:MAG: diaminopimelate decarboxylase [Chloroflexia bacterium]|nr:diaminopimelate decarboxylase [Chloroflexia bacterium]